MQNRLSNKYLDITFYFTNLPTLMAEKKYISLGVSRIVYWYMLRRVFSDTILTFMH